MTRSLLGTILFLLSAAARGDTLENVTVRVKLNSFQATGTIIASDGAEAIVLTCSHLWGIEEKSDPVVVLPDGSQAKGELIRRTEQRNAYCQSCKKNHREFTEFGGADLAVVRVKTSAKLASAGVTDRCEPAMRWSVGEEIGSNVLTVRSGPLSASMFTVEGRSGGGVFDADGSLTGVISARSKDHATGYFSTSQQIHQLLTAADKRSLFSCHT